MNIAINEKTSKYMAYSIVTNFLVIHVAMFIMFHHFGVTPMARFNIFSILFYLLSCLVIRNQWWRFFIVSVYLEVCAHMSLAVYYVGWGSGFQVTLIGLNILAFFGEYCGRSMRIEFVRGLPLSLVGVVAYLASYVISTQRPAPYVLPEQVSFWLQIIWALIVFVINIIFVQIFVLLAVHSETMLANRASHDRLTGLPNRYFMAEYLAKKEVEGGLSNCWVAMADIDDFKQINDTYGHNCGDRVLKTLADILSEGDLGIGAVVCRWGGEEFLILGHDKHDEKLLRVRLDRLREEVESHDFVYGGRRLNVTITIGAAPYEEGRDIDAWIDAADKKLYEGKKSGKNKVVL